MKNTIQFLRKAHEFHGATVPKDWYFGLDRGNPFATSGRVNIQTGEVYINRFICGKWTGKWESGSLANTVSKLYIIRENARSEDYFRAHPIEKQYVSMSEVRNPHLFVSF